MMGAQKSKQIRFDLVKKFSPLSMIDHFLKHSSVVVLSFLEHRYLISDISVSSVKVLLLEIQISCHLQTRTLVFWL